MANEIKVSVNVQVANPSAQPSSGGQFKSSFQPVIPGITQAVNLVFEREIVLSTSATAYTFTGITTNGWVCLQNMDTTQTVEYGPDNAGVQVAFGSLKPGEAAVLRMKSGVTINMKSVAGTPTVWLKVFND